MAVNGGNGNPENGSVMEKMLKLFEPPGGYPNERETELHPYFKRPGRGHNHDTCDSCKEGGALICCDSCPASFHLQCHDPPLEDDDIPEGDWMCIRCYATKSENPKQTGKKHDLVRQASRRMGKIDEKPELEKKVAEVKQKKAKEVEKDWKPKKRKTDEEERPKRTTRLLKKTKYNDNSTEEEFSESDFLEIDITRLSPVKRRTYIDIYRDHMERKPRTTSNLFKSLVKAANMQNAEEFSLPKSLYVPEKFPYAWKWSTAERKLRSQMSEEGDGRGKLKVCYVCGRSSRVGPLIQCDFCSLLFHMDCLDPPLAEVPSDVWMCPNHVESLLDSRLTSARITERVKLWDTYANQPIDQEEVKTQFMRKCSKQKMFQRKSRTVAERKRVQVPGFIKVQYLQPAALLPGPGYDRWVDPVQLRKSGNVQQQSDSLQTKDTALDEAKEEEAVKEINETGCDTADDAKASKDDAMDVQEDTAKEDTTSQETSNKDKETTIHKEAEKEEAISNMAEASEPPVPEKKEEDSGNQVASVTAEQAEESGSEEQSLKVKEEGRLEDENPIVETNNLRKVEVRTAPTTATYTEEELEWVSSLVSLQTDLLRKKMGFSQVVKSQDEESLECAERLPSQDRFEDRSPDSSTVSGVSLSGKVASEEQLMEQLQEYLITHTEVDNLDPVVLKYLAAKQINKMLPTRMAGLSSNVMVRASLTPVGSRKQPYYMQYRTLEIGTGPDTNLNLRDFGHCNHLSDRHATLFFDELSGQYELINYSLYGTIVDECIYTIDIGCVEKRYKRMKKPNTNNADTVVMAGRASSLTPCYCPAPGEKEEEGGAAEQTTSATKEGFEGSALLHHGTRIKFGCLEFVFAVAAALAR